MTPQKCPFRGVSEYQTNTWDYNFTTEWHFNRFCRFNSAHTHDQHRDHATSVIIGHILRHRLQCSLMIDWLLDHNTKQEFTIKCLFQSYFFSYSSNVWPEWHRENEIYVQHVLFTLCKITHTQP